MDKVAYRKAYRVKLFGRGGYEVTIPKLIIDRAAASRGMTSEDFIKTHQFVHLFNDFTEFDGAYRFERIPEPDQEILVVSEEELKEMGHTPSGKDDFDEMKRRLGK